MYYNFCCPAYFSQLINIYLLIPTSSMNVQFYCIFLVMIFYYFKILILVMSFNEFYRIFLIITVFSQFMFKNYLVNICSGLLYFQNITKL